MKNIAFIAACFPEKILNKLIKQDDITDIAANVFGYKISKCLSSFANRVIVINEHKTHRFPKSPKLIVNGSRIKNKNVLFDSYRYINIPFLDRISKEYRIRKMLKREKPDVVVVYCMHTPYLRPAVRLKKKIGYKLVLVVPDLPEFMLRKYRFPLDVIKKKDVENLYQLAKYADGFIVLTKYMQNRLPVQSKNVMVLEGIADIDNKCSNNLTEHEDYILYAGTLSKEYGLPEFIDSYIKSGIKEKLFICGGGPYEKEIMEIANTNASIEYLGVVNREELFKLQSKACLLVNPRSCHDKYTKYSFPSKTLEYLASGTPVMMEKLAGVPKEYYSYIIEVKNSDWVSSLKTFSASDRMIHNNTAEKARQYIIDKKTLEPQARRIKTFIEELVNEK